MSIEENQKNQLDLITGAHGLDPVGHFFISESLRHIGEEAPLPDVEFVVHYGGAGVEGHFNMWNPVFVQQKERFLSIFRGANDWWKFRDHHNVIPVAGLAQIEILMERLPNLKAVLYPANYGSNHQWVQQNELQHIHIGHGDSNKSASANKVFRLYDEVWVAGEAHIERFKNKKFNISGVEFKVIGQPWMKPMLENIQANKNEAMNWCYFPTWKGHKASQQYSSISYFNELHEKAFSKLPANSMGLIKLHPLTELECITSIEQCLSTHGKNLVNAVQAQPTANQPLISLAPSSISIGDALTQNPTFVVCDISAAVTECLYLNVPIMLFDPSLPSLPTQKIREMYPGCYLFKNAEELNSLLVEVILKGNDTLSSAREDMLAYTVDIAKTKNGAIFQELDRISRTCHTGNPDQELRVLSNAQGF